MNEKTYVATIELEHAETGKIGEALELSMGAGSLIIAPNEELGLIACAKIMNEQPEKMSTYVCPNTSDGSAVGAVISFLAAFMINEGLTDTKSWSVITKVMEALTGDDTLARLSKEMK